MDYLIVITLASASLLYIYLALRARKDVRTSADFYTFPINLSKNKLIFTLTATNVSLVTVYVGLSALGAAGGMMGLWGPVVFCLGMAIFPLFFPKMAVHWRYRRRLPEIVQMASDSQSLRVVVGVIQAVSFILFYYVEIWGLSILLRGWIDDGVLLNLAIILLAITVPVYVSISGFRAVVKTDVLQLFSGLIVSFVLVWSTVLIFRNPVEDTVSIINGFGLSSSIVGEQSLQDLWVKFSDDWAGILQYLSIYLLAQLAYYDNWHRLEAFYHSSMLEEVGDEFSEKFSKTHEFDSSWEDAEKKVVKEAQKSYLIAAATLFALYFIWPALSGIVLMMKGVSLEPEFVLAAAPLVVIAESPFWFAAFFFGLLSATLSTADTYLSCMVTTIQEDVLKNPIREDVSTSRERWLSMPPVNSIELYTPRLLILLVGSLAFVGTTTSFDPTYILTLLFVSDNGYLPILIGSLLFPVVFRPVFAGLSILIPYAVGLSALVLLVLGYEELEEHIGIVVLLSVTAIAALGARKKLE